jgi:hypothetical protein
VEGGKFWRMNFPAFQSLLVKPLLAFNLSIDKFTSYIQDRQHGEQHQTNNGTFFPQGCHYDPRVLLQVSCISSIITQQTDGLKVSPPKQKESY